LIFIVSHCPFETLNASPMRQLMIRRRDTPADNPGGNGIAQVETMHFGQFD
jgi:hypothetical protein